MMSESPVCDDCFEPLTTVIDLAENTCTRCRLERAAQEQADLPPEILARIPAKDLTPEGLQAMTDWYIRTRKR